MKWIMTKKKIAEMNGEEQLAFSIASNCPDIRKQIWKWGKKVVLHFFSLTNRHHIVLFVVLWCRMSTFQQCMYLFILYESLYFSISRSTLLP